LTVLHVVVSRFANGGRTARFEKIQNILLCSVKNVLPIKAVNNVSNRFAVYTVDST
jgi:hypothetical protein